MAYIPNTADTTDQTLFAPGSPGVQPPPATSTGQGGGPQGPGAGQGVVATPTKTSPPPVVNLGDYLAANAPQEVGMGQQIAGNLEQTAGQVSGDINADQAAVDQTVQASNVAPNPTLVSEAAAAPSEFVTNPDNLSAFLAQENAKYAGPTSFESTPGYQPLATEVASAEAKAPDVTQTAGVQQLVAGQEANPTTGETNLDTMLLEQSPEAMAAIAAAEPGVQGLGGELSNATTAEDALIAAAQANDVAAPAGVQTAFETGPNAVVPALKSELNTELANAQQTATAQEAQVAADLQSGNVTEADLQALGIPPDQWAAIESQIQAVETPQTVTAAPGWTAETSPVQVELANYLSQLPPATAIGVGNVETPADVANINAIKELLQTSDLGIPGDPAMPQLSSLNIPSLQQYLTQTAASQQDAALQVAKSNELADSIAHIQSVKDENDRRQATQDAAALLIDPTTGVPTPLAEAIGQITGLPIKTTQDAIAALTDPRVQAQLVAQNPGPAATAIGAAGAGVDIGSAINDVIMAAQEGGEGAATLGSAVTGDQALPAGEMLSSAGQLFQGVEENQQNPIQLATEAAPFVSTVLNAIPGYGSFIGGGQDNPQVNAEEAAARNAMIEDVLNAANAYLGENAGKEASLWGAPTAPLTSVNLPGGESLINYLLAQTGATPQPTRNGQVTPISSTPAYEDILNAIQENAPAVGAGAVPSWDTSNLAQLETPEYYEQQGVLGQLLGLIAANGR